LEAQEGRNRGTSLLSFIVKEKGSKKGRKVKVSFFLREKMGRNIGMGKRKRRRSTSS